MHPSTVQALGQARLAGLHRQAQRDTLARVARRARPPRQQSGLAGPRLPAVGRRILTVLAARSALMLINGFARIVRVPDYPAAAAVFESFFEGLVYPEAPQTGYVPLMTPSLAHNDACPACRPRAGHRGPSPAIATAARYAEPAAADHVPWACAGDITGEVEQFLTGTRQVPASHRPLAAVLFTDIAGSTAQAALLGDRAWTERLDQHDEMTERQIRRFAGLHVKNTGDGSLATFDAPARAIQCALAIRDALGQLGLDVRAGVHIGEIELRGDDVAGIAVHIAHRVCSLAAPGDVLVSRTVVDLVAGSDIAFEDLGEHKLKGIPGHRRLFAATDRPGDMPESAATTAMMR